MVACSGSPLFTHMFMLANSHGDSRALLCSESLTQLTIGMQPCSKAGICWKAFLPTDMFRSQLSPERNRAAKRSCLSDYLLRCKKRGSDGRPRVPVVLTVGVETCISPRSNPPCSSGADTCLLRMQIFQRVPAEQVAPQCCNQPHLPVR